MIKKKNHRQLSDLVSVGPATLEDFRRLGIESVEQLAEQEAEELYERLCCLTRSRQDPCVKDVFEAAIAQAKNPNLPKEECQWWTWSRRRLSSKK